MKPSVTPQWGLTNQGVVLVTLVVQLSSWGAPSRGVCPSEGASMPAWWLGSRWVLQGEVWDRVQHPPCGLVGDPHHPWHSPAGEAALGGCTGRASAQVDTKKLKIVTNGELMDITQVGQIMPDSTQGMGRVPAKRTGDEVADKRVTTGESCVLGHGRREASSMRDGTVPLVGDREGTAGCCISSSVLLPASCCCEVRLRDCQGTVGMAGTGTQGARGSSALKTEPPACCYLLNNRGAGGQLERNVIPESLGRHLSCRQLP